MDNRLLKNGVLLRSFVKVLATEISRDLKITHYRVGRCEY